MTTYLALLLATSAQAITPEVVGLHIGSHHFTPAPKHIGTWNDNNPGVYARWSNGVTTGTLRNSERRQSVYLAMTWETPRWHGLSAAITAGGITGYAKPVSPLLAASGSLALTDNTAVRLTLLPKAHPKASAAAHLSVEWSF